jgi:DNA adenine methylase
MSFLTDTNKAKPFLKWAGGKGQLLPAIESALPKDIASRKELTYIEPFIGSGAVLFWFLKRFPQVTKAVINDINPDLYKAYSIIRNDPHSLIQWLSKTQDDYYQLKEEEDRKQFFLEQRERFNTRTLGDVENTGLLIFLNRTCFNGLYRVNSKGRFNVPFGRYDKPKICDAATILTDSQLLQKVVILQGDYEETLSHAGEKSFFYFDPPYKPISKTASFNAYAAEVFDDVQQERLKNFCIKLNALGFQWLLSNSDVKNTDEDNHFFEDLYNHPGFRIKRVKAKRNINSVSSRRGEINELLIANYEMENDLSVV